MGDRGLKSGMKVDEHRGCGEIDFKECKAEVAHGAAPTPELDAQEIMRSH
jgi:hypothetical protein